MSRADITLALDDIGPMTQAELRQFLGLHDTTIYRQLQALRQEGKIHITRYERQPDGCHGKPSPVFAIGKRVDAVKLPAKPQAQRSRDYKDRHAAIIKVKRAPVRRMALGMWAGLGALPARESAQGCSY